MENEFDEDLQELQAEALERLLKGIRDTDDMAQLKQYSDSLDKLGSLICKENELILTDNNNRERLEFEKIQKEIENEETKKISKWENIHKWVGVGLGAIQLAIAGAFIYATHKTEEESYDKTPATNKMAEKMLDRIKFYK